MKTPTLKIGDAVAQGIVQAIAPFADHVEYLVQQTDGTASWLHENKIVPLKPETTTLN
jgi:hypothetical protein